MSWPRYRIVVDGGLEPRRASPSDGMTRRAHDGEMDTTAPTIDQSHLQVRIESVGITPSSLTSLKTENALPDTPPAPPRIGTGQATPQPLRAAQRSGLC